LAESNTIFKTLVLQALGQLGFSFCKKVILKNSSLCTFKGTVSRDFRLLVFFHESVSPKPLSMPLGCFEFFQKFAEVFPAQGLPPVSTTPVANAKNLQS
jgi:hypothetical protein